MLSTGFWVARGAVRTGFPARGRIGLCGLPSIGAGIDTATYENAAASVVADLGTGTSSGADGNDTFIDVENLTGSANDDTLSGDVFTNVLKGGDGADTLNGREGVDLLEGEGGDDPSHGGRRR